MNHHLVIVHSRYLAAIFAGRKTVECRFSRSRRPPFGCVRRGDVLWLKRPGGPVIGRARVRAVQFLHPLTPPVMRNLIASFKSALAAPTSFFRQHKQAQFATLVHLRTVTRVQPIRVAKRDRRAWVVLGEPPGGKTARR